MRNKNTVVAAGEPGDPPLTAAIACAGAYDGRLYAGLVLQVGERVYGDPHPSSVNLWTVRVRASAFLERRRDRAEMPGDPAEVFRKYRDAFHVDPRDPDRKTRPTPAKLASDYAWQSRVMSAHYFHEIFCEDLSDEVAILLAEEPGGQVLYHRRHDEREVQVTRYRGPAVDRLCERLVVACDDLLDRHRPALHATPLPPG